tara:strand:+ start:5766 stop:6053 length:288 start_codon:yes stop_codon:yes gene_type:complete
MEIKNINNTTIFFEFNRDKDKKAPNKIEQIKEIINLYADFSTLKISFSLGINSSEPTIAEFTTFATFDNSTLIISEIRKVINKPFYYIIDNKLYN